LDDHFLQDYSCEQIEEVILGNYYHTVEQNI